jgi:hypothetical protein
MYVTVRLQDFIDNVAQAICGNGIGKTLFVGYGLADKIRIAMQFNCAPTERIDVDCHWLWREFVDLHEYYETDPGGRSYRELAKVMLEEVIRSCATI